MSGMNKNGQGHPPFPLLVVVREEFQSTLTTESCLRVLQYVAPVGKSMSVATKERTRETGVTSLLYLAEASFPPHGRDVAHDQPHGTVPGNTRKRASRRRSERLGKRNRYAVSSSIHRASSFVEPRTPDMYGRECPTTFLGGFQKSSSFARKLYARSVRLKSVWR
jgi:hypothetical protein